MRTLTLLLAALLGVLSRGVAADGADEAFSQDQLKRERDLIGLRGPVGPRGNHGPLGRKGARGDVGPGALRPVQGKVGPQGHRGPQGFTGAKGAKGSKGVMGVVGPTGPVGEMGTKSTVVGPKGFMGEPGPAGPSGEPGPRGVFGPWAGAGPKGARGPKGDAPMGPKGDQGVKGSRGVVGPVGKRGKRGPPGIAGFAGEQGVRGPVGPDGASEKGPQGDVGAPGPKGNIGLRGPRGPQGKKGLRGYEGVYGPKGIKGPPGYRGKRGPRGVAGTKGNPGRPGVQGDIGPQGKKGEQGARGPASMLVAPKGRQGFPGEDGDDGHRGDRGAKGPDGPKGRPNFEVGPRGPEGKRGEANHRPQTKFYRLMSGDWLRKNALFFSKPEKLSDDDDADERERKMLKIQGSDAGSMLFAVPLAGPGELSPGRHYVAELHVAAVDLSADNDLFVGIADGSRVAGFLRSEAGNAALGKVMHGLENRTRDRLDQIEDAEARASSELLQTSVSGEGALRQMRIARPDTLLEVDTPHLAPPADERPPPSAAQQLSEQEALLAKENAETIARQHTVAREVADAAKDKEEIAAGKEPSIDPKFNPKWFTILIRIDTAEATEVLARTTGNQMPVMSAVPFKLNAEEGLSIVAYADDPAERYGIYAIEATLHEESP